MAIAATTIAAIRWGYGFRPGETPPDSAKALLADLTAPETPARIPDLTEIYAVTTARATAMKANRVKEGSADADLKGINVDLAALRRPLHARRLLGPMASPQGFRERLVTFWADHFTVASKGAVLSLLAPHFVETAIRPNIAGRFVDLLLAAELHPGMIGFLDQNASFGPNSQAGQRSGKGLNENLAREILELHTLGVGGSYTQGDVREFAELLTGYSIKPDEGTVFLPQRAEPGPDTVLGRSYGGDRPSPDDAVAFLRDLAGHPDTARHIATKLVTHFVTDTPDPGHVGQVAEAWGRDGDLMAVYAALLDHPAAWATPFVKARQPFDFLVAMLRAFDAPGLVKDPEKFATRAVAQLKVMGQPLLDPAGPDGWPEEAEAWITPQGIAARVTVVREYAQRFERRLDPRAFLASTLQDAAGEKLAFAVSAAEQKWEGIALTLLSPEFNRR